MVQALLVLAVIGLVGENVAWLYVHDFNPKALEMLWADKLGFPSPFPELKRIEPGSFLMGTKARHEDSLGILS